MHTGNLNLLSLPLANWQTWQTNNCGTESGDGGGSPESRQWNFEWETAKVLLVCPVERLNIYMAV